MTGKLLRTGGLAIAVGWLAGCPSTPQAVRETVVRTPVASPRSLAPAGDRSPVPAQPYGGQSPVPYYPGIGGTDPPASGPGTTPADPSAHLDLGPECKVATVPTASASPTFRYAGKGLYAGPFQMGASGTICHVEHLPDGKPGSFVLHLDSDDQREKNLALDAVGPVNTTFKFPSRSGPYAFFLQMDPPGPWSVDVYAIPASPSPSPSSSPKASASPSPSPSASASVKP
ncbi:MAG: hypothetical protein JWM80_2336 [Cyanobacteria bacterium RYN_339]|nr:hypothetical protein [Cyanobacteria bacterium RYN_339]